MSAPSLIPPKESTQCHLWWPAVAIEGEHLQVRMRHGSAETILNTYSHLWPDKDESTKAVIDALVDSKFGILRTEEGSS